jgi:hypothetical protein
MMERDSIVVLSTPGDKYVHFEAKYLYICRRKIISKN